MSQSSLMSVREVIDSAFGEHNVNTVNFKLLQTVLHILAKQLRLLERHVEIIGVPIKPVPSVSKIVVSEVKMQASTSKGDPNKSTKSKKEKNAKDKTAPSTKEVAHGASFSKVKSSLESLTERQERELRIINQRADSREEPDPDPKPMASALKIETEKLFVVERVPTEGTTDLSETVQLSIVTKEQFQELAAAVRELEALMKAGCVPGFPENAELMKELRKGASLTDAMAALQLSARLEAAEKALGSMTDMVTDLLKKMPDKPGMKELNEPVQKIEESAMREPSAIRLPYVTREEFDDSVKYLYDDIMESAIAMNKRTRENADAAIVTTKNLEKRLEDALDIGDRMEYLETMVNEYAVQVNSMDTELAAQMTGYQEQLTQMQYDLDVGLEALTEAVTSAEGDPAAVAELNAKLTSIHNDIDNSTMAQKELEEIQKKFSKDLANIWGHFEILRESKSDREEVEDALRDKAGLADLNGRVRKDEFEAVRADYEKRITAAYSKFDNQELIWQRLIEDLVREINEKADWIQTMALRDEINMHIKRLHDKIEALSEIVGEPRVAAISRRILGMGECLSCSKPGYMDSEEPDPLPQLAKFSKAPRPPVVGAENSKPQEDGDHRCYPGQPITHTRDPRSYFCHRFCGGAHTLATGIDRVLPTIAAKPLRKNIVTGIGSDGKGYLVDDTQEGKPCGPCNQRKEAAEEQPRPTIDPISVPAELTAVLSAHAAATELTPSYCEKPSVVGQVFGDSVDYPYAPETNGTSYAQDGFS